MKTFLLDKTYRVIAIGNPINQENVTSLYVSYITKKENSIWLVDSRCLINEST